MKNLLLILASMIFLSGNLFAYESSPTGLGGFNNWYNTWTKSDEIRFEGNYQANLNNFYIKVNAKSYNEGIVEGSSQLARVELQIQITDSNNVFNPEWSLPLIVRGILASYHRDIYWHVDSRSVVFERIPGQRTFSGHLTFFTKSNSGAEIVEVLNKLEVLIPGVSGVGIVSFAR
jgi:hypothetical protein